MGPDSDVGRFLAPFLLICILVIIWIWKKADSSRSGGSSKWYLVKVLMASYGVAGIVFFTGIFIELVLFGFNGSSFMFSHIIVIVLVAQLVAIPFVAKYMK